MKTTQNGLTGEFIAQVAFVHTGIEYQNIIGKTFLFAFDEGVIQGTILSLYVDNERNIKIWISNFQIKDFQKITYLKWLNSEKKWKLFYDAPGEILGLKYILGDLELI